MKALAAKQFIGLKRRDSVLTVEFESLFNRQAIVVTGKLSFHGIQKVNFAGFRLIKSKLKVHLINARTGIAPPAGNLLEQSYGKRSKIAVVKSGIKGMSN
ncbi:hypothetical protein [Pedobacter sp.]|uniref:hypothetical protein n=1 Tax=Pedobacter sp. TaxID=1411316 RepID=UPI003BAA42C9